jgi:hypothetical protein
MLACMKQLDTHLKALFSEFVQTSQTRAPLYSAMSRICSEASWCHDLMSHAPPLQRLPVLWFACLHRVCLDHPEDPLSAFFPDVCPPTMQVRTPESMGTEDLRAFCERHEITLRVLLSTRSTQTNEVGRCAVLLPVILQVEEETDRPILLLDVGTSAGLNLHLDRYNYRYESGAEILIDPSAPLLQCGLRGSLSAPQRVPRIVARRGIDANPLDVTDDDDMAWLRSCVWADQIDRSRILTQAIDIARHHPVEIFRADAATDLTVHLRAMLELASQLKGHLILVTTWVLSYLSTDQIAAFDGVLNTYGRNHDFTWLGAEQPDQVLPIRIATAPDSQHLTHVVTRRWRNGIAEQTTWATAHPHGYWMHWKPINE